MPDIDVKSIFHEEAVRVVSELSSSDNPRHDVTAFDLANRFESLCEGLFHAENIPFDKFVDNLKTKGVFGLDDKGHACLLCN